MKLPWPAKPNS